MLGTFIASMPSPVGELFLRSGPSGVEALWMGAPPPGFEGEEGDPHGALPALAAYFSGALAAIESVPVAPAGTDFQRRVWAALREIPVGRTESYGALAHRVGSVARAVGTANGANPVGILVPCHRVIGQKGDLVGYAGGIERKRWLLRHEGVALPGEPLRMF